MITIDTWTFVFFGVLAAFGAYRINAKRGAGNLAFVVTAVVAVLLFGMTITNR